MTEQRCQLVRLSAMAARDGEAPPISPTEVAEHMRECADCREEMGQMQNLMNVLDLQRRWRYAEDLRPRVYAELERSRGAKTTYGELYPLRILVVLLAVCKAVSVAPGFELSVVLRFVPLVLAASTFLWLRVNPFRINPQMRLQGEDP